MSIRPTHSDRPDSLSPSRSKKVDSCSGVSADMVWPFLPILAGASGKACMVGMVVPIQTISLRRGAAEGQDGPPLARLRYGNRTRTAGNLARFVAALARTRAATTRVLASA